MLGRRSLGAWASGSEGRGGSGAGFLGLREEGSGGLDSWSEGGRGWSS